MWTANFRASTASTSSATAAPQPAPRFPPASSARLLSPTAGANGQSQSQTAFSLSNALNIFLYNKSIDLGALINMLQTKNLLQILAEPNLLAIDGKPASFLAGGEFPYPTVALPEAEERPRSPFRSVSSASASISCRMSRRAGPFASKSLRKSAASISPTA